MELRYCGPTLVGLATIEAQSNFIAASLKFSELKYQRLDTTHGHRLVWRCQAEFAPVLVECGSPKFRSARGKAAPFEPEIQGIGSSAKCEEAGIQLFGQRI